MKNQYYFIAAALPPLQIGYPPEITSEALEYLLRENLHPEDYAKSVVMRRYYDIQNIRSFWLKFEQDSRGYYNENELEEALVSRIGFPEYVYAFLEKYQSLEDRLHHFAALVAAYFHHEIEHSDGFLHTFLKFERELRLVLTGFRAKQLGRDLAAELQYEDPMDEIVAQILAQKDAKTYEPPEKYAELKVLFEEHNDSPLELHQALCEYRFRKIEEMYGVDVFSIDRILSYLVRLIIVEKWLELDKKKGLQVVEEIMKDAS